MPRIKTHVNKGDSVLVISGNHKGKTGNVLDIQTKKNRVVVEGVCKVKKTVRRSEQHPDGEITEIDGSIHISNVKKVD